MVRVLVLHIYSPGPAYEQMLEQQRRIPMSAFPDVARYFVTYRANPENQPVVVEGDMVFVQGEEHGVLGITEKTLVALTHLLHSNHQYDYVLRSNISTFLHYRVLLEHLENFPRSNLYTGAFIFDAGVRFAQGTCILLSADQADKMVQQQQLISREIVDDVTFAHFFCQHSADAFSALGCPVVPGHWVFPHQTVEDVLQAVHHNCLVRLRVDIESLDRTRDIEMMRRLVDQVCY